jgi:hypothetical protein
MQVSVSFSFELFSETIRSPNQLVNKVEEFMVMDFRRVSVGGCDGK